MFPLSPLYIFGFCITLAICFQSVTESPAGIVFLAFLLSLTASHYYFKDQVSESFHKTKKNIGSELYLPYTAHIRKKFENWITILYMMGDFSIWTKSIKSLSKNQISDKIYNLDKYKTQKIGKKKSSSSHIQNLILSNFLVASKVYTPQNRPDTCKIHWNSKTLPPSKFSLWQIF